jgi:putative ABC transport system permease protein
MLRAEALIVATIGIGIGTLIAIAGLIPLAVATAGSPIPSGPVLVFFATVLVSAGLVVVPTAAGARITLRRAPAAEVEAA